MARQVFQKVSPPRRWTENFSGGGGGGGGGNSRASGLEDDLDPDADPQSQHSGPDAGGGEEDRVLPTEEWEVVSSSTNYTMDEVDCDR